MIGKNSFRIFVGSFLATLLAISCDVLPQQTDQKTNERITVVIGNSGKSLPLKAGIPASALDITKDNVSRYLSNNIRSQITNIAPISMEEIQRLYEDALKKYTLPSIDNLQNVVNAVQTDAPNLEVEFIRDNYEQIEKIYKAQIIYGTLSELNKAADNGRFQYRGAYPGGTNLLEFLLLISHPWYIDGTKRAVDDSFNYTVNRMGENGYQDKSDAFRHAFWNCLIAQYIFGTKNDRLIWAKEFTDAHENGGEAPTGPFSHLDNPMDFHNNAQGRDYWNSVTREWWEGWWIFQSLKQEFKSVDEIANAIRDKANDAIKFSNTNQLSGLSGYLVYIQD